MPGGYFDALNPNTKLGKAVRAACDELQHLNAMVGGWGDAVQNLLLEPRLLMVYELYGNEYKQDVCMVWGKVLCAAVQSLGNAR